MFFFLLSLLESEHHPPSLLALDFAPFLVFRGEQVERLFDAFFQPSFPSGWFSVGLVNPSRIVFRPLDEMVRVVGVFRDFV